MLPRFDADQIMVSGATGALKVISNSRKVRQTFDWPSVGIRLMKSRTSSVYLKAFSLAKLNTIFHFLSWQKTLLA